MGAGARWLLPRRHPRQGQHRRCALIANPLGGVTRTVEKLVRRLSKIQGVDGTKYGVHSLRSFYAYHAAAISMACVRGDAEALVRGASCKETRMTRTG